MSRALIATLLALTACSADGGPDACTRTCGDGEVCILSDTCVDRLCPVCVKTCATNTDCPSGHPCVQQRTSVVCSERCVNELCPSRQTCSGATGSCLGVGCTSDADCTDLQFCDPSSHACYALEGGCRSDGPACRSLPAGTSTTLKRTCDGDSCLAIALPPATPSDAPADARLLTPVPAGPDAQFATVDAFGFSWAAQPHATFAFVSEVVPTVMSDLSTKAIWADALAAGETSTAWAKGVAVSGGKWGTSPGTPPLGKTLFFTLVAIEATTIRALSRPTPFIVGSWKIDGETCADEGVIAGECRHPARARVCASGVCRTICESHVQCTSPQLCGRANGPLGLRLCGG